VASLSLAERDLTGANLNDAGVRHVDFFHANLNRATLDGALARNARFDYSQSKTRRSSRRSSSGNVWTTVFFGDFNHSVAYRPKTRLPAAGYFRSLGSQDYADQPVCHSAAAWRAGDHGAAHCQVHRLAATGARADRALSFTVFRRQAAVARARKVTA
jgi:hypothetical protein